MKIAASRLQQFFFFLFFNPTLPLDYSRLECKTTSRVGMLSDAIPCHQMKGSDPLNLKTNSISVTRKPKRKENFILVTKSSQSSYLKFFVLSPKFHLLSSSPIIFNTTSRFIGVSVTNNSFLNSICSLLFP